MKTTKKIPIHFTLENGLGATIYSATDERVTNVIRDCKKTLGLLINGKHKKLFCIVEVKIKQEKVYLVYEPLWSSQKMTREFMLVLKQFFRNRLLDMTSVVCLFVYNNVAYVPYMRNAALLKWSILTTTSPNITALLRGE